MKKVGLISYHFLNNYGTILQAYALQRKICDLGHEAEYIDYRFRETRPSSLRLALIRFSRIFAYFLHFKKYYNRAKYSSLMAIRNKLYDSFYTQNINTSRVQYPTLADLDNNPPLYDIYIVGSDQVWNPNLTCASSAYFLSFVSDGKKKASYAPSVGVGNLTETQRVKIAGLIKDFSHLSCREKIGADLLSEISGRSVSQVLDPTLLIDRKIWEDIATASKITKPYILCYFLGNIKKSREFVKQLEIQTGLTAYYIPCSPLDMSNDFAIYEVGPAEFLGLVKDASYVCTDSFHGSVFSIIFKKQFFSFCKRADSEKTSDNSRIYELLKSTDLESRLIKPEITHLCSDDKIDFSVVSEYLDPLKTRSEKFLLNILNSQGSESNVV